MPSKTSEWLDAPTLFERQDSFRGGMEAHKKPVVIADDEQTFRPDQCAELINVEIESGQQARTRPGTRSLDAASLDYAGPVGRLVFVDTPSSDAEILALGTIDGEVTWMYWTGTQWASTIGDPEPWKPESVNVATAMGVNKLLASDGEKVLQIYDPATAEWTACASNTGGAANPPIGATVLLWHTNRMFAAGMDFTVPGGTDVLSDAIQASDILEFGDGHWDQVKWSFRVGTGDGQPIVALAAMQGYMLAVFKRAGVYVVDVNPTALSAADWSIYPLSAASGIAGPNAVCALGNSLLYVEPGVGVRSISRMEAAVGQWEISPPLSQPLQPWVDRINWDAGTGIVAHNYRHLALFFVPLDNSTTNNACLVFNGRLNCWQGVWTGLPASAACTGFVTGQRLILGMADGRVVEWLDYASRMLPDTFTDDGAAIATSIRTRNMQFGDAWQLKVPQFAEVRVQDTNATLLLKWIADEAVARTESLPLRRTGAIFLDVDTPPTLPFTLPAGRVLAVRRTLRGTPHCQEAAMQMSTASGNLELRNWSAMALPGRLLTP